MTLTVREYETEDGTCPFRAGLETLDRATRARIQARLMFGPGYCIYFARDGATLVLLLVGGSKATQVRDIRTAQRYWRDYLEEK